MTTPLNNIIRRLAPAEHYTPITIVWEIRQALMGNYEPMENPPFKNRKEYFK